MNKMEIVDEAWKGFINASPDMLIKLTKDIDQKSAMKAAWRLGFFYALLTIEKGIIKMETKDRPSKN